MTWLRRLFTRLMWWKTRAIRSVANGLWSDPTTWEGGKVPGYGDAVEIDHHIQIDLSFTMEIETDE